MLIDGIRLREGSSLKNAAIASGTAFPSSPDGGELFFRSDSQTLNFYNSSWKQLIDATSIALFAPSLTGVGATGTWAISITGTSAKASTVAQGGADGVPMTFRFSNQTGQPTHLWGTTDGVTSNVYDPANFNVASAVNATFLTNFAVNTRATSDLNTYLVSGTYAADSTAANTPIPSYGTVATTYPSIFVARNIDAGLQIAGGYNLDNLYFRGWSTNGSTFTPWRTIIHSGNLQNFTATNATRVGGYLPDVNPTASTVALRDPTGSLLSTKLITTGNIGVGVTPSNWGTIVPIAVELKYGGSIATQSNVNSMHLSSNMFYDGTATAWKYTGSGIASRFVLNPDGQPGFALFTAPSGTAGNVPVQTQAITFSPVGALLINTTTDNATDKLQVNGGIFGTNLNIAMVGASASAIQRISLYSNTDASSNQVRFNMNPISGNTFNQGAYIGAARNGSAYTSYLTFGAADTEWMRLSPTGLFGIGSTAPTEKLHLASPSGTAVNLRFQQTSIRDWYVGMKASDPALYIVDGSVGLTRMTINTSGVVWQPEGLQLGHNDYARGTIQNVLSLLGDGVSGKFPIAQFRFYVTPGFTSFTSAGMAKLSIRGWDSDINTESADWLSLVAGNLQMGAGLATENYHIFRKTATVGNMIVGMGPATGNSHRFYVADTTGANAAVTVYSVDKANSTGRSISAAGTINAGGADYAEYMTKASDSGEIAKGDIVGVDKNGQLTDKFADSLSFLIKSTNPSYVGGDSWGAGLDDPEELEAARQKVDRIAYAGQTPVNIQGAKPGQFIIPVQNDENISAIAVDKNMMSFDQYISAIGIVQNILPDGRANVRVKVV